MVIDEPKTPYVRLGMTEGSDLNAGIMNRP